MKSDFYVFKRVLLAMTLLFVSTNAMAARRCEKVYSIDSAFYSLGQKIQPRRVNLIWSSRVISQVFEPSNNRFLRLSAGRLKSLISLRKTELIENIYDLELIDRIFIVTKQEAFSLMSFDPVGTTYRIYVLDGTGRLVDEIHFPMMGNSSQRSVLGVTAMENKVFIRLPQDTFYLLDDKPTFRQRLGF